MTTPKAPSRRRNGLVEDARVLRAKRVREALRAALPGEPALLAVRRSGGDGDVMEIGLVALDGRADVVRLAYNVEGQPVSFDLVMVSIPQPFGGVRWYFRCPSLTPCTRRVHALYLPPGGQRFACRRCHDLTYHSVQRPVV